MWKRRHLPVFQRMLKLHCPRVIAAAGQNREGPRMVGAGKALRWQFGQRPAVAGDRVIQQREMHCRPLPRETGSYKVVDNDLLNRPLVCGRHRRSQGLGCCRERDEDSGGELHGNMCNV